MSYRIVLRNGGWYVPQYKAGQAWHDFLSTDPGEPWLGFSTRSAARTAALAGPASITPDSVVETG